jgi:hypothetical protein
MARTAPVTSSSAHEIHSPELPITQPRPILDGEDRRPEVIVTTDAVITDDYAAALAFMEEPVDILLHRGREKHAPTMYDFSIDGRAIWIRVDTPTTIKRKYLEIIARAQPFDVETEVDKNEGKGDNAPVLNNIRRHQSSRYPFTVVKDSNPRGPAWLAQVMRES